MTIAAGIWALVPFKGATGAKRRLEPVLNETDRETLVFAMVRDVLDVLTRCRSLGGILLVSRDSSAFQLAEEFGIDVFEDAASDLSGAVVQASDYAGNKRAAVGTLFVPGDVPLIQPQDVDAVLDGHEHVTLVPDANDIGTNAAVSSPPNAFEYLGFRRRPTRRHQLAEEFGIDVFEDAASDLSGAVVQASDYAGNKRAAVGTLFVPGDVPLIQPQDVDAVLDGHEHVTLVPDANDIGTNAAVSSPPNAFEYLFDGKSFKPHIAAARRAGIEPRIVRRTAWGWSDVDTVHELAAVAARAVGTRGLRPGRSSGRAASRHD